MKKTKLLLLCVVIPLLFTSCLIYDDYYESTPTSRELVQSSIYSNNISTTTRNSNKIKHHYEDDNLIVDMGITANKIILNIENISGDPILLDFKEASILTRTGDVSRLITYNQTRSKDEYLTPLNYVVNPMTTYNDDYVALDSVTFNTVAKNRYFIEDWTNKYNLELILPYKVINSDDTKEQGIIKIL